MEYTIRHWLNYTETVDSFEPVTGVSETVPDQSYTVRDLLERFASGTMPSVGKDGFFYDESDVVNWVTDPTLRPDFDLADYTNEMLRLQEQKFLSQQKDVVETEPPSAGVETEPPSAGNEEVPPTH